jgi:hypothetical protein
LANGAVTASKIDPDTSYGLRAHFHLMSNIGVFGSLTTVPAGETVWSYSKPCPAEYFASGGGFEIYQTDMQVLISEGANSPDSPSYMNEWFVEVHNPNSSAYNFRPMVFCTPSILY